LTLPHACGSQQAEDSQDKEVIPVAKQLRQGIGVNLFSNDELYELHLATLELLQQTGVRVEHDRALDIFDGGGCIIDKKKKLVKIPPHVVEDAIRSAPSEILLAGRNPKYDIVLGGKRVAFTNFGEALMVIDPFTGERRESTKQDVASIALVTDALSEIDVTWRPCAARDVSSEVDALHVMEALLANTTKPIASGDGGEELTRVRIEMAAAVAGGKEKLRQRPLWTTISAPASPLTLGEVQCGDVIESAMAEVPHVALSMGLSGGTSPVTLAGALVVHNAEVLAEIVLSQLTRKGAPIIYGSSTTCMDLKTATTPVGSPELAVFSAAVVKLAQYYRLCSLVAGG